MMKLRRVSVNFSRQGGIAPGAQLYRRPRLRAARWAGARPFMMFNHNGTGNFGTYRTYSAFVAVVYLAQYCLTGIETMDVCDV